MAIAVSRRWERRIDRARDLAAANGPASSLLATYARLLELQRDCYDGLRRDGARLSGSLERDLPILRRYTGAVLSGVSASAPPAIAEEATGLLEAGNSALNDMLVSGWRVAFGQPFLARMILQPYTSCLSLLDVSPVGRPAGPAGRTCPFCGGVPQLAILQSVAADDGASRYLLCATCSTTWRTGRFACANCGEEDERHLPYFQSTELTHVRVDACDACRHYLKTVDLTRLGTAEPVVDEVAGGALDLWAVEHGFTKIELNLLGL